MNCQGLFRRSAFASAAIGAFLLAVGVSRANADTITFDLTFGNPSISGFPSPYATVSVTSDADGTATFTVTASNGYLAGGQGVFGFNVNTGITLTLSNFSSVDLSAGAEGATEDGLGHYSYTLDNFDGFQHALSSLSFDVTGTFTDAASLLGPNEFGYEAAAHIFIPNADGSAALATGYASGACTDTVTNCTTEDLPLVPEPGSLMLLGSGLMGAVTMVRMRRRSKS